MNSGIYMLVNKFNGNTYIGQSNDIDRRWMEHKSQNGRKVGTVLGRALNKYGIKNFKIVILELCAIEALDKKEQFYIEKYCPAYNMNKGGVGNRGHKVSNEIRELLSELGKRQWSQMSPEKKKELITNNLHGPRKGHSVTFETREKIRRATIEYFKNHGDSEKRILASSRPVAKIDIVTGEVLQVYKNLLLAGSSVGVSSAAICYACKNSNRTSAGYKWVYYENTGGK